MKKITAIILLLAMTVSLTACGNSGTKETSKTESAAAKAANSETTTVITTTASAELKQDDSGEGSKTLDSVFGTVTVPEGMKYKIYFYSYSDDNLGTIKINFGKKDTSEGCLEISTTRIIGSLDDAVNECIKTRNLDTYKEGKSEIGEEITLGKTTYKKVKMSHEYGAEECLVSYYKRADGKDIYIEIKTKQNDFSKLEIDDSLVKSLAESAVYK